MATHTSTTVPALYTARVTPHQAISATITVMATSTVIVHLHPVQALLSRHVRGALATSARRRAELTTPRILPKVKT